MTAHNENDQIAKFLKTNLKNKNIEKTYIYYDGPCLYISCYDDQKYLVSSVAETYNDRTGDSSSVYLYTPVTDSQISDLENNRITLYDAHKEFSEFSFLLTWADEITVSPVLGTKISDDYLAVKGIYLYKDAK